MLARWTWFSYVVSIPVFAASAPHALEGCWEGPGSLNLIYVGAKPCSRVALRHEITPNGLTMKMLAIECPNFARSWQEKKFEVRNVNEIWGRGGNGERSILGFLEKDSYFFDDPQNIMSFIEYRAAFDAKTGRLAWRELFSQNQKTYWQLEADVKQVPCESVKP